MNLNEECLLQFLKNDLSPNLPGQAGLGLAEGFLTRNLRRIFRQKQYVSFPVAILVRRPVDERE